MLRNLSYRWSSRSPRRQRGHRASVRPERGVEQRRRRRRVVVCAADRLGDDLVDDAEREQVWRRDLQGVGGLDLARGSRHRIAAHPSGGMTLYTANSCIRIRSPIAMPSAPPLPPSPQMFTMIGTSSRAISRRFTAMASAIPRSSDSTPGYAAGVSTKTMIGPAELLGQPHRTQRFAIALGLRIPEVPEDLLLGVAAALVVADDEDRQALVGGGARHDRVIVGKPPIAMNLDEVGEQQARVFEDARTRRVPRDLDALPRRQVRGRCRRESTRRAGAGSRCRPALRRGRQHRERLDLLQQHADGFFELEKIGI